MGWGRTVSWVQMVRLLFCKQIPLETEASDFPVDNYQTDNISEYCPM